MITITGFKTRTNTETQENFTNLVVAGGIELIKSKVTGRNYLTNRKAEMSCTFSEDEAKSLVGSQIEGVIAKVNVAPYEYALPSGEVLELDYSWEVFGENETIQPYVKGKKVESKEEVTANL